MSPDETSSLSQLTSELSRKEAADENPGVGPADTAGAEVENRDDSDAETDEQNVDSMEEIEVSPLRLFRLENGC